MFEDEDEEIWVSLYENGHWEWDTSDEELKFISDLTPSHEDYMTSASIIRTIKFRDDIDLWEQHHRVGEASAEVSSCLIASWLITPAPNNQRFRKHFQRKINEDDVVTLQDVKDVVLYTTPSSILSSALINLLHLPTTEQFLRALILCCQYYLQISEVMTHRTIELETKIRTKNSDKIESKYREDLEDLRLLVANKYTIIILGAGEFRKYHHMGKTKSRSLSKKEASMFEILICIAIQIVWIALGRKHYIQIELEINRILKSDIYNSAEHKLHTKYVRKMNAIEKSVLIGHCVSSGKKVNTRSPLINEVFCDRNIGFRLYELGELKYSGLSARQRYLESFLSEPEHKFGQLGISLGVIGLPRSKFDIMLREIKIPVGTSTSSASLRQSMSRSSRVSRVVSRKSTVSALPKKLYPDIYIPEKSETKESLPDHFPQESLPKLSCNIEQRIKWIGRVAKKKKTR